MPATILDLPVEIHLHILRFIQPYDLLHAVHLVNQRFRSCVEDIFRNELLPALDVRLHLEVPVRWGDPGDRMSTEKVSLTCSFQSADDQGLAYYKLERIKLGPKDIEEQPGAGWRSSTWGIGMAMEVCLPPNYSIHIRGQDWKHLAEKSDQVLGEVLILDWRPLVAMYLEKAKEIDEIASTLSVRGSQAEAIYRSMFSY